MIPYFLKKILAGDINSLNLLVNLSILARLEDFVDLDILINLKNCRIQHFATLGMFHYT